MVAGRQRTLWLTCLLALGAAVQLTGCGQTKTYGAVQFSSVPQGAEVVNLKDDASLGMTPVAVTWESEDSLSEYISVEFIKKGYDREIASFWVNARHKDREAANAEPQPVRVELKKRR